VRKRRLHKSLAAIGVTVAAATAVALGATTASADGVLSQWYLTAYDCQYAGNVYAQQGLIHNFTCTPGDGGYILTGWN